MEEKKEIKLVENEVKEEKVISKPKPEKKARVLQAGMNGKDVLELKKTLNRSGFVCGEANDKFCGQTEAAVKQFQHINDLKVTGVACQKTIKKIME